MPQSRFTPLRSLPHGATFALSLVVAMPAFAAEEIGKAERIENAVTGRIDALARNLAVPDVVHRNEQITTKEAAQAHLRFKDETDLRLGPQASLKLDAFVYSGDAKSGMELAAGAMRFVSGTGPKGSYRITTPVATIGLRGTTVEVTIRNGRTYVSLHEGEAEICTRSGRCMDLKDACTYLYVDARGVTLPQPLTSRVPTYSGQCKGDFCAMDRCTPQIKGERGVTPPAATPPKAKPPKAKPPKGNPPRKRASYEVIEEDIIDEPVIRRPGAAAIVPGLLLIPGLIGPGRGRYPGGIRVPGTRSPTFTGPRTYVPGKM